VLFLSPAIAADEGAWRDALIDRAGAMVVCVGPAGPQPPAETEPQRRIGLLAIEQAVWAFADRDARFTVAASRTELDWALKSGRPVVWAPTHMATATLQRQAPDASDPLALASWLADEIGATRLLVAGAPVPPGTRGQAITRPRDLADPGVTG
jgi:7,8-dihydroneopterin aldolase/epimerase/oxygenase